MSPLRGFPKNETLAEVGDIVMPGCVTCIVVNGGGAEVDSSNSDDSVEAVEVEFNRTTSFVVRVVSALVAVVGVAVVVVSFV